MKQKTNYKQKSLYACSKVESGGEEGAFFSLF